MASPPAQRSVPLFLLLLSLLAATASSLTCTTQKLTGSNKKHYSNCIDLPTLNTFLHWTHDPSNSSLSVAFVATPPNPSGWVSWAINPTGTGMAGAQALVAYKADNNGAVTVKTFDLKSYSAIVPGNLSFDVWDLRAEEVGGLIRIFATVKVPENAASLNQVWQVGPGLNAGRLKAHDFQKQNLDAKGTLSLNGGQSMSGGGGVDSRTKRKNIHGVLNAVSWGVLFPLGVIIARYLRTFPSADPAWFYLHVACQVSAYAIGVAGWGTGLKLGSESVGIQYSGHRNIGIALFCLATVQIFALFIRPKKDHKYRYFWNIYHHSIGYTIIVLGIINIFRGFDILSPEKKWKSTYIIVIAALGVIALLLEVITWIVVLKRKSNKSTKTYDGYNNGQSRQRPLNI